MMQQVEPELYRIGCIPSPYATAPITGKYDATPYKKLVDLPPHKNYISNLLRSWSETEATRREHELNVSKAQEYTTPIFRHYKVLFYMNIVLIIFLTFLSLFIPRTLS